MTTTKVTGALQEDGTKGADIASAGTLAVGTDGSYFDITGTTGITGFTVDAGRTFTLQFDGIVTLTNGASLVLSGAANFTTAAGDRLTFTAVAADTVVQVGHSLVSGGSPVASSSSAGFYMLGIAVKNRADASADQSFAGCGFTPDMVIFNCGVGNDASGGLNFGYLMPPGHGVEQMSWQHNEAQTAGSWEANANRIRSEGTTPGSNFIEGMLKQMDADGFTITWTKTGSPVGTMNIEYVCIKFG